MPFWRRKKQKPRPEVRRRELVVLKPVFVETIPVESTKIKGGTLYVSMKFDTIVHRCPCGCGSLVEVTLHPATRSLTYDGQYLTIKPSIGVKLPCRSHYSIIRNEVVWSDPIPRWAGWWYDRGRKESMGRYEDGLEVNALRGPGRRSKRR